MYSVHAVNEEKTMANLTIEKVYYVEGPSLVLSRLCGWSHGGIKMEQNRGVNLPYTGGGDLLCTLHRGEGPYGKVCYRGI